MPLRRIFFRGVYRPARISMLPGFSSDVTTRILPLASGLRDSYAFWAKSLWIVRTPRTPRASSCRHPTGPLRPEVVHALGILRECAKLLRSSWLMYPVPDRVYPGEQLPQAILTLLPRLAPAAALASGLHPLICSHCSPARPLVGSTHKPVLDEPSGPAFMMAFITLMP